MRDIENYFDGDIIDAEYYDVEDEQKQTQVYS